MVGMVRRALAQLADLVCSYGTFGGLRTYLYNGALLMTCEGCRSGCLMTGGSIIRFRSVVFCALHRGAVDIVTTHSKGGKLKLMPADGEVALIYWSKGKCQWTTVLTHPELHRFYRDVLCEY